MQAVEHQVQVERLGWYPSLGVANRLRVRIGDDRETTAHVARWPADAFRLDLVAIDPPCPVERWCREHAHADALSGGFFTKPLVGPLGDLVVDGREQQSTSIPEPWSDVRGTIVIDPTGTIAIGPRSAFGSSVEGSLLQAGPLLVADGEVVVAAEDPEGFRTTCEQFDSDITAEPLPRVAIATTFDEQVLALVVDGRGEHDDGVLLPELAALLVELGARDALNLDGGSSSALVTAGVRRNEPRDDTGTLLVDGYPTASAFVVRPR